MCVLFLARSAGIAQAVLVVGKSKWDLQELKCWSKAEGKEREYSVEKKLN